MITESFLISCIRRLREYGEGIAFADQSLSSLKEVVKSNVYTIVCLSQSGYKDMREVIKVMGLNPEQADIIIRMEPGEGIIRKSGGFPYPQLIKIPFIKPKNVSDREIDNINVNDPLIQSLLSKVKKRYVSESDVIRTQNIEEEKPKIKITDKEKILLDAIFYFQHKREYRTTEIYKIAKLPLSTGSTMLGKLVNKNLVKAIEVPLGKKGRPPKYLVLLPEGYKVMGRDSQFYGKGAGPEHILFQHLIAEHFSEQKPVIEFNRNNKFIDVAIETNEFLLCIEVAMTSVHERVNIEKDFNLAKADFVIVACKDKKVLKAVQNITIELPELSQIKTEVCLVSELLSRDVDEYIEALSIDNS